MSDELKCKDPLEARWQPVAVVSLGEEKRNAAWSPTTIVCEIGASIVLLFPYWDLRTAFLLACLGLLSLVVLWIALRRWNLRSPREV
jgi:hypothetical protein